MTDFADERLDLDEWKPHVGTIKGENCASCAFSQEDKGASEVGYFANFTCHIKPPTIQPGLDEEGIGWWPSVSANGWCSKWRLMTGRP